MCDRKVVVLSDDVIDRLKAVGNRGTDKFRVVQFQQRDGSVWQRRSGTKMKDEKLKEWKKGSDGSRKDGKRSTLGYLTYVPTISPEFPSGAITAFGMDGPSTLIWAHSLATKYKDLLNRMVISPQSRIIIGEFTANWPEQILPVTLVDVACDDLKIILDVTL